MFRRIVEWILFGHLRFDSAAHEGRLLGKTILVTGASYGIGEALVGLLAGSGARLLLVARSSDKLHAVRDRARSLGAHAQAFVADLRSESDMTALLAWLDGQSNPVDVVVHNAGKSIHRSLSDSLDRFHDFQRTMAIHYLAPVRLTLHLLPVMCARGGQILNVSAANVLLPAMRGWAAYQASKCAFDQWLGSARAELGEVSIRTSTAYLPLVRTRMIQPGSAYARAPAMEPQQAALRLLRLLERGRGDWAPWWLGVAVLFARSVPRWLWDRL